MKFLGWMYEFAISAWIRESDWGHPLMLCFHALGMAVVVGVVVVLSLRVASGWPKGLTPESFDGLLRLAQIGFLVNFASGLILFIANGPSLTLNWTFQLKIALIVAGGLSVLLMWRMIKGPAGLAIAQGAVPMSARIVAALTIAFWLAAIVAGRYIAYTLQKVFV